MLYNDNLNDDPASERVESFGGGVDAYRRSTLIDLDQSQLLENVLIRDNFEARTRPGIESIGPIHRPTALYIVVVSATSLRLNWTDNNADETAFDIYRSTSEDGPFTLLNSVGAGVVTFLDATCSPNTLYYYKVLAVTPNGDSPFSNVASATTPPAVPSAIVGLVVTPISTNELDLAWDIPIGGVIDNVLVKRATSLGGSYSTIATLGRAVNAYNDTGLTDGSYFYKITAVNSAGSTDSAVQSGTTYPIAPTGLSAVAVSGTEIDLAWTNNSPSQTAIIVSRTFILGGVYADIALLGAGATAFSDTGLSVGAQYWYRVRARNATGDSTETDFATATTISLPTAPVGLAASSSSASAIGLTWFNTASNADSIEVLRATVSGGPYTTIASLPNSSTSYADTGRAELTTYFYAVQAVNTAGVGLSSEASATTRSASVAISTVLISPTITYFDSAASIPAGTYQIVYVQGAFQGINTGTNRWNVQQGGSDGLYVFYGGGSRKTPGNSTLYLTQSAAESANAGASATFVHTGGQIYLRYTDSGTADNMNGSPNPTFYLVKQ